MPVKLTPIEQTKRDALRIALRESKGNKTHAANHLGITKPTVYAWIRRFGIKPKRA